MKHAKDLSWLSAPAFLFIIGMLIVSAVKQNDTPNPELIKVQEAKAVVQK